jgi:hypothetical protein
MYFLNGLMFGVLRGFSLFMVETGTHVKTDNEQRVSRETGFACGCTVGLAFWVISLFVFLSNIRPFPT